MDDKYRFLTTAVIWVMVSVILLGVLVAVAAPGSSIPISESGGLGLFAFVLIIIAGISTDTIWRAGHRAQQQEQVTSEPAAKVKRVDSALLARLVDELSQDEVVELETLLLARDDLPEKSQLTE